MNFFNAFLSKIGSTLLDALRQGWSRSQLAWAISWGATVGIFPIYGFTTLMLVLIGQGLKLNHVVLQGTNYLLAPLKLALILPHIRFGEWLFRVEEPFSLSIAAFTRQFQESPLDTLQQYAMTFLHAFTAWIVLAPFSLLLLYAIARIVLGWCFRDATTLEEQPA